MTRFEQEISGRLGAFWKSSAEREVEHLMEQADKIIVEADGAARWAKSGNYLPKDVAEKLAHGGFGFSKEATEAKRKAQVDAFLSNYREPEMTEELAYEMRAAFGDQPVYDIITGRRVN